MSGQKSLGEILVDAGLITKTQLKSALADQNAWGGRLGYHLVKAGAVTEEHLLDALSHQLGIAKISLRRSRIYKEALELVPKQICIKYGAVPVAVKQQKGHKKLLVVMCDPTNYQAVQEIEFISGHSVVSVVGLDSEIERAINYCYHPDGLRESDGLSEVAEVIEFEADSYQKGEEPVIITAEGEHYGMESRIADKPTRVLVDLLVEKGLFTVDEFRDRLDQLEKKE